MRDVGEVVALRSRLAMSDRIAAVGKLAAGIAHEIVQQHGGNIEVESSPGGGSVFRVRLPIHTDGMDPRQPVWPGDEPGNDG